MQSRIGRELAERERRLCRQRARWKLVCGTPDVGAAVAQLDLDLPLPVEPGEDVSRLAARSQHAEQRQQRYLEHLAVRPANSNVGHG